jgi:phosphate transport system substrate-binding protein
MARRLGTQLGGEATLTENLSFFEVYGYPLTEITVASGAFDVDGKSNGPVIFVNRDNPIAKLTVQQLDGIFGAERTAGMRGFKWTPSDGRGPQENIRTWGQLGLIGEWADKPIQTYGHAPSGTAPFFQWKVLKHDDAVDRSGGSARERHRGRDQFSQRRAERRCLAGR